MKHWLIKGFIYYLMAGLIAVGYALLYSIIWPERFLNMPEEHHYALIGLGVLTFLILRLRKDRRND